MWFHRLAVAFVLATVGDVLTTFIGLRWFGLDEATPPAERVLSATGFGGLVVVVAMVTVATIGIARGLPRLHQRIGPWVGLGLLAYGTVLKVVAVLWNVSLMV